MYSPWCTLLYRKGKGELYTDIGVGLSALLVSTNWAMREPLLRGTSDRTGSTFWSLVSFIKKSHKMNTDNQTNKKWEYNLVYTYQEKSYTHSVVSPSQFAQNQYEVIAYGWLLEDAERYGFNNEDVLREVCLLETGEDGVRKPVWVKETYPIKYLR